MSLKLGQNLKKHRKEHNYTLDDLAALSGVSRAMISSIERDAKNPTINVLVQLAGALGVTVSALIDELPPCDVVLTRKDNHQTLINPDTGVKRQLLSPDFARRGTEILRLELGPHADLGEFAPRHTRTYIHMTMLTGRLECRLGEDNYLLEAGDSVTFLANVPRSFKNKSEEPCSFVAVVDTGSS